MRVTTSFLRQYVSLKAYHRSISKELDVRGVYPLASSLSMHVTHREKIYGCPRTPKNLWVHGISMLNSGPFRITEGSGTLMDELLGFNLLHIRVVLVGTWSEPSWTNNPGSRQLATPLITSQNLEVPPEQTNTNTHEWRTLTIKPPPRG
jgi:hypothetical protein